MAEPTPAPRRAKVLLVDDEPANLDVLRRLLEAEGYQVLLAPGGEVALRNAGRAQPDLILLDVMMPDVDGYEVCRRLKAEAATREIPVVFCTARDLADDVVRGFDLGAVDYIVKPFREREVLRRVETHVAMHRLAAQLRSRNADLEREIARREELAGHVSVLAARDREHWGVEGFVGRSATIRRIFDEVHRLQESPAATVLITGESGTGKELIARALHHGSPRRDGPFLPVNCAALPGELAESLLFGHRRGAFTGATEERAGCFEAAHGGTLFLDEVGEMPLAQQSKLLRVLEDGEVTRVGAHTARRVDVRVVAATNIDLPARIAAGAFRRDLYYRLARFTVDVPPLRERPDDVPLLAGHFAHLFATEMGRPPPAVADEALAALGRYPFPGNVRELKNAMEQAVLACAGADRIEARHLRLGSRDAGSAEANAAAGPALPMNLDEAVAATERWAVERALAAAQGNLSAATRMLGTNRNRVYRILGQGRGPGE